MQNSVAKLGLHSQPVQSGERTLVVINEDTTAMASHLFSQIDGVDKIINTSPRFPLCAAESKTANEVLATIFGEAAPIVVAGPCSVEGREQIVEVAEAVKAAGSHALRGGAFKPRTNPYDFSGLGQEGLEHLAFARTQTGLPVVTEVLCADQIEAAHDLVDVFQIGARNMYNYELLREVGRTHKPVLLKRAMSATIDELLQAAEYI
ncbi:MAG: 3-deoxy-7-phosphoheptulonate synthase, partial [Terriglobales bacterium]